MPSFDNAYAQQLHLLIDVLPSVAREAGFALKGGTAINLFFRDLPRLSVDIDLTWLPLDDRTQALAAIAAGLDRIATALRVQLGCRVQPKISGGVQIGLSVRRERVSVQVDVTPVLRGAVFAPELRRLRPAAEERYGFAEIQTLGFADVFAGKLVAALDRQHPRDLFDVMHLLANEGITDDLWAAFLVYATASSRPIAELVDPNRLPLEENFVAEFAGMTEEGVDVAQLESAREALIASVQARIDDNVRAFLLSVEREAPEWERLGVPAHVAELPGIRWKLWNLGRRSGGKRGADWAGLVRVLERVGRPQW